MPRRSDRTLLASANRTNVLSRMFTSRYEDTLGPATSSPFYLAGRGAMRDESAHQARRDASAASARGATGTEFEIAQGGARQRSSVMFLRQLLQASERARIAENQGATRGILGAESLTLNARQSLASIQEQRSARRMNFISSLFSTAASTFLK